MPSHKLPQTAPDTIADHRASERTRGDKPGTAETRILNLHCSKHQQVSAPQQAVSFDALVFRTARQAALFWKQERTGPLHIVWQLVAIDKKFWDGRSLQYSLRCSRNFSLQRLICAGTAKVFSRPISGEDSAKRKADGFTEWATSRLEILSLWQETPLSQRETP